MPGPQATTGYDPAHMSTGEGSIKARKRARLVAWLQGDGVEIGALHNPLQVPPAARVTYVDRMREDELRAHYPELAHAPFAPVSVIGDAHDLSAFDDASVDFVIANHLLEHLEDPVRGLVEMTRVLRDRGILYVALPHPEATFDRNRPLTTVDHLIAEHRDGPARSRRIHFEEWVDHVEPLLGDWHHVLSGLDLDREGQVDKLLELDYSIHFHVWKPAGFLAFLAAAQREFRLAELELLAFETCTGVSDDDEFVFVFGKGTGPLLARPAVHGIDEG
jgi:SAM-dependent methyltransferase